jgi:hypothetical protein
VMAPIFCPLLSFFFGFDCKLYDTAVMIILHVYTDGEMDLQKKNR